MVIKVLVLVVKALAMLEVVLGHHGYGCGGGGDGGGGVIVVIM